MMRSRNERMRDRAAILAHPVEDRGLAIAQALIELAHSVDDASERVTDAIDELRKDLATEVWKLQRERAS